MQYRNPANGPNVFGPFRTLTSKGRPIDSGLWQFPLRIHSAYQQGVPVDNVATILAVHKQVDPDAVCALVPMRSGTYFAVLRKPTEEEIEENQ